MADTYYAWSRFKKSVNEWGRVEEWIEPGAKISKSDLNVGDDEWQALVDAGAVRTEKYPDVDAQTAPVEALRSADAGAETSEVVDSTPLVENPPPPADGGGDKKPWEK